MTAVHARPPGSKVRGGDAWVSSTARRAVSLIDLTTHRLYAELAARSREHQTEIAQAVGVVEALLDEARADRLTHTAMWIRAIRLIGRVQS